ncbi:MAG: NADH-quinone oxidoreductase subunit N [Acidobacteriota bacterium]|nr:NADH-quinone oxidoreductase subunit N [Acidobacteriota bacterium]
MTARELPALLPLLVVALTALAGAAMAAVRRSHTAAALVAGAGLTAALACIPAALRQAPQQLTPLLVIDPFGLFWTGLIIAATLIVVVLAHGCFARRPDPPVLVYTLLPAAATGAIAIVCSSHFASLLLGVAVSSVASYGLMAGVTTRPGARDASVKYLVLAAASTAVLVLGMALIYARLGTMEFGRMMALFTSRADFYDPMLLAGLALLVAGLGFHAAFVPFHPWMPDVYEAAPAPVAAFIETVSKSAVLALLIRDFRQSPTEGGSVYLLFTIVAVASLVLGNLLALRQASLERLLGYASIAHTGALLVAFQAGGRAGAEAATFYLTASAVAMLGAFGSVTVLSSGDGPTRLEDCRGWLRRRPLAGGVMTVMLLSLAGIPLTVGFRGIWLVAGAARSAGILPLLMVLVAASVVGLVAYLRVILVMGRRGPATPAGAAGAPAAGGLALGLLTALILGLGVWPVPLVDAIHAIFNGFV